MILAGLLIAGIAGQQASQPCTAPEVLIAGSVDATICDGAIEGATTGKDRAQFLLQRAYQHNEKQDAAAALADLDKAVLADPTNLPVRQERAYSRGEMSDYAGATADLDLIVAHGNATAAIYSERAYDRTRNGDLAGALADREKVVALTPNDASAQTAGAEALIWLGRFDEARAALDRADALAALADNGKAKNSSGIIRLRLAKLSSPTAADPEAGCRTADRNHAFASAGLPAVIANCTAAFLRAKTGQAKAELLTIRSIAWMMTPDDAMVTGDRQIAVGLDPGNADWHANLGSAYVAVQHSWAGAREFDRALAIKQSWHALAGRASARYNVRDFTGAFADAKRSFELQPNELALTVLGDLAINRHDEKSAKLYWMGAYRLGDRDDGLIARLKDVGITDPEHEPPTK
jgi:tetratricopeptide (TPR) repeat protein